MSRENEAVLDAAESSSYGGSSNTHGKKKAWKRTNTKNTEKQDQYPKGSMSELKGHYFSPQRTTKIPAMTTT